MLHGTDFLPLSRTISPSELMVPGLFSAFEVAGDVLMKDVRSICGCCVISSSINTTELPSLAATDVYFDGMSNKQLQLHM